jgi:hypothetical protein
MSLFPTLSFGRSLLLGITAVGAATGLGLDARAAEIGQATVKSDSAPVYSRTSARAPVVKTFKKGDRVTISFEMLNAEGAWCSIAGEAGQRTNLGYMPCEHLEREPEPQPVIIATKPASAPETPQRPAPTGRAQPAPGDSASLRGENYMRQLSFWTGWPQRSLRFAASPNEFNFTTEQQAQVEDLTNRMGVSACRQQIEAHYRRFASELRDVRGNDRVPDVQAYSRIALEMSRERDSFFYPCDKKMLELLERVPTLLTPEQRSVKHVLLEDFEQDVAKWRRALTSPNGCCWFVPTQ